MDKGKKLVFDDEGNAHEMYELEDEDDFRAKGLPEEQRQKFIDAERDAVAEADVLDKAAAKAKRKEKARKRKERERGEVGAGSDQEGVEIADTGEDALANFRADADFSDDDEDDDEQPQKQSKKWFQSDSEEEAAPSKKQKKSKGVRHVEEPQTLEDMEALAAGLLS
jgi:ATP-dependent RNA helicase DDX10/DBP4